MIHHFPILILCLLTFICLFNPTLSDDICVQCKKRLDQTDKSSNPAIELPKCKHYMHKNCLKQKLEGSNKSQCPMCQQSNLPSFAIHKLHNLHKHYDESDRAFIGFVKDKLPTEECQKELKKKGNEEIRKSILYDNAYFYETHLGVLFLMHENWNCAKFKEEFENEKYILKGQFEQQKEIIEGGCERYQNYVNILYEYFFWEFLAGKKSKWVQQIAPAKPIFKEVIAFEKKVKTLIDAVNSLSRTWDFLFRFRN